MSDLLSRLNLHTFANVSKGLPNPTVAGISSPFATTSSHLKAAVFRRELGLDQGRQITRRDALRFPPVQRGRNLLVTAGARNPLVVLEGDTPLLKQPIWTSFVPTTSPQLRTAWWIDDLIFYGVTAAERVTFADGTTGPGPRIPADRWGFNDEGRPVVDDVEVDDDQIIVIWGYAEGILTTGDDALNDARKLYGAVRTRLNSPVPPIVLQQTDGEDLTNDEIDAMIDRWVGLRNNPNGGVGFANRNITVVPLAAADDAQMMVDARNAMAVDLARMLNVSAGHVDATSPKSSLNYETQEGRAVEFYDLDLSLWTDPIAARLSLDDIVPSGQRVAFDTTAQTTNPRPPTGAPLAD